MTEHSVRSFELTALDSVNTRIVFRRTRISTRENTEIEAPHKDGVANQVLDLRVDSAKLRQQDAG